MMAYYVVFALSLVTMAQRILIIRATSTDCIFVVSQTDLSVYQCSLDESLESIIEARGWTNVSSAKLSRVNLSSFDVLAGIDVKIFEFELSDIDVVSDDPVPSSTHLERFSWSFTGIRSLPEDFLTNKGALRRLTVQDNRQLEQLPAELKIPTLEKLFLSNNNISAISSTVFADLRRITTLRLDGNPIAKLPANAFFSNYELTKLHLSFYGDELPDQVFNRLLKVEKLSVVDGSLRAISKNLFSSQVKLKDVDLRGNSLTNAIDADLLSWIVTARKLKTLNLQNNPWQKSCSLAEKAIALRTPQVGLRVSISDSTSTFNLIDLNDHCQHRTVTTILALSIALTTILASITSLYLLRRPIKIWLFAHRLCLRWVTQPEPDADSDAALLYDAFLSYAHPDEPFIVEHLLRPLETTHGFRLCVHQRDFVPGELIGSQIINAIVRSRRTIVYLSRAFLESRWARHEFRTAFEHSLHQQRLIVILAEAEINEAIAVDAQLALYLRTRTYLRRDDGHFWRKLLYAMPHRVISEAL